MINEIFRYVVIPICLVAFVEGFILMKKLLKRRKIEKTPNGRAAASKNPFNYVNKRLSNTSHIKLNFKEHKQLNKYINREGNNNFE